MKKTIRKVGTSKGIIFSQEESKNYDLEIDDILDIKIERKKRPQKKDDKP